MAYAPERAATLECHDAGGRVLAYVKVHWDAAERELANAEAAVAAVGLADPHLRLPRVLAASLPDGALVLEPLGGDRLDGIATAELGPALRALGAALATLHGIRPLPPRRFDRLDDGRLALAADVLGRVRPDCRDAAEHLLERLRGGVPGAEPVHLHGDANLRNALLDGGRVGLVDLEDATAGPAAADLGFVLAGLLAARAQGRIDAARAEALAARAAARLRGGRAGARRGGAALARRRVGARARRGAGGRPRPARRAGRLEPLLRAARGAGGMSDRPPLLCYCQHSVGLGHLIRSYALCAALVGALPRRAAVRRRAPRRDPPARRRAGAGAAGARRRPGGRLRQPRPALLRRARVGTCAGSASSRRSAPCGRSPCWSSCSRSGARSSRASSCRCSRPRGRTAR